MIKDIPTLLNTITTEIKSKTDIAVLGLSGGADSTLVACLCTEALGKENVYGVHMPFNYLDATTFNALSKIIAENLEIRSITAPISNIVGSLNEAVEEALENSGGAVLNKFMTVLNKGNSRSRARMCILYAISHHLGTLKASSRVRVIGTGNLSEDFIGYDSKGGDSLADIFPIGELFKSEVYQLLEYFKDKGILSEAMINRKPSAGLWDGQSDEEELGYTYNSMEQSIRKIRKVVDGQVIVATGHLKDMSELDKFVIERYNTNKHKHEAPPVISLREFCD